MTDIDFYPIDIFVNAHGRYVLKQFIIENDKTWRSEAVFIPEEELENVIKKLETLRDERLD